MKTIFEHTQSNVLVIPQALFAMKDVKVLKQHHNSAVFYKSLDQDLTDVEFYTNTPCLIYIVSGLETITNSRHEVITLNAGSAIFLPQGATLNSDFVKETQSLKAYLVFFDDDVILEYLSKARIERTDNAGNINSTNKAEQDHCLLENCAEFTDFFNSLHSEIADPEYLKIKLQELLHLIAWKEANIFHSLITNRKRLTPQKNLQRLLETLDVIHLSVSDMADISGRSISSFNRHFKEIYDVPPKKWLQQKKLLKAKALLAEDELSVTEVASSLGYDNVSAFIKAFKLMHGVTPKQIKAHI